jgi:uncharacterized protein YdaU (DUF1376 family)
MNFYKHHIGDYAQATAHLSFVEDAAYSRMIRKYYAEEKPLPADIRAVQRLIGARSKEEREAVEVVLNEFFELQDDGWHNKRCDEELSRANAQAETNKRIAEEREARKKAAREAHEHSTNRDTQSHESLHEPSIESLPSREPSQTPDTRHQTPDLKTSISDTSPESPDAPDASSPTHEKKLNGYGPIAIELMQLGVKVTSINPYLIAWVDEGFPAEKLREAVAVARQSKPVPESIPAKYLDTILRSKPKPVKDSGPPWWATDKGIDAKGSELGMRPKGGESYQEYKARIQAELTKRGGKHGN